MIGRFRRSNRACGTPNARRLSPTPTHSSYEKEELDPCKNCPLKTHSRYHPFVIGTQLRANPTLEAVSAGPEHLSVGESIDRNDQAEPALSRPGTGDTNRNSAPPWWTSYSLAILSMIAAMMIGLWRGPVGAVLGTSIVFYTLYLWCEFSRGERTPRPPRVTEGLTKILSLRPKRPGDSHRQREGPSDHSRAGTTTERASRAGCEPEIAGLAPSTKSAQDHANLDEAASSPRGSAAKTRS